MLQLRHSRKSHRVCGEELLISEGSVNTSTTATQRSTLVPDLINICSVSYAVVKATRSVAVVRYNSACAKPFTAPQLRSAQVR